MSLGAAVMAAVVAFPHPMDGLLRWSTGPAQGEEALAESGAGGTVWTDGRQVWMAIELHGEETSITWDDRDRLFWVETVREVPDRAAANAEIERIREGLPVPVLVADSAEGIVVDWRTDPAHMFSIWAAPSEKKKGGWSVGRKWMRVP